MPFPTPAQIEYMTAHAQDDRRPNYVIATSICFSLATLAFVSRFFSRYLGCVKLGMDDWLIIVGMFFTTAYVTMLFVLLRFGMGRHVIFVTDPQGLTIALISAETLYAVSICFIKLSVLGLYRRLFPQQWFRITSVLVGVFILLYTITKVCGDIFQCVPIRSHWDPTVSAKCIDFSKLVIVHGVLNIFTDFVILALPMPILWNLNLNKMKKWALTFVLLVGAFVCIISVVRLPICKEVDTPDPSWDFVWPLAISAIECCGAVIAACVPTYRPFFNFIVNGSTMRSTRAKPSRGASSGPRSSFSNDQLPLSSLSLKSHAQRTFSPKPDASTVGSDSKDQGSDRNYIMVTKSFSSKTSQVRE